jgi:hypothetical protein
MKNLLNKLVEVTYGAKVYANHTAIKGKKSGGSRDNNGTDWKEKAGGSITS